MAPSAVPASNGDHDALAASEKTQLSQEYDTPLGLEHGAMSALKDRIKQHYDLASDYYLNLWGEHIHHGYYPTTESKANDSKEVAQVNLIQLLLQVSKLPATNDQPLRILDVGCGIGGTSRYLAQHLGADVTGITISGQQVTIAKRLTQNASAKLSQSGNSRTARDTDSIPFGNGSVHFIELDAEKMSSHFTSSKFDVVWISEALSHFPNKPLFFQNAFSVLKTGGRLVIADWFRSSTVPTDDADIRAIEDGMLLPPLCTQEEYVDLACKAGLEVLSQPKDISTDVAKTWDISWSLVQNPSLWAFAFSQGRDGIAFLQSFRAMRRGYANGSFRYAVISFQKP